MAWVIACGVEIVCMFCESISWTLRHSMGIVELLNDKYKVVDGFRASWEVSKDFC